MGPVWTGGSRGEAETLADCYRNSLRVAVETKIKTIAFPAISCGAYRYPVEKAAQIALETTRGFLETEDQIDKVVFVVATDDLCAIYRRLL